METSKRKALIYTVLGILFIATVMATTLVAAHYMAMFLMWLIFR